MDGAGSSSAGEGGDYDDEPVLKYQRMGADVASLLSAAADDAGEKETVVRMAVHDTCLVGTAFSFWEFSHPGIARRCLIVFVAPLCLSGASFMFSFLK